MVAIRLMVVQAVSSTNKSDRHNIAEILLKVALNTIPPFVLYIKNVYDLQESNAAYYIKK